MNKETVRVLETMIQYDCKIIIGDEYQYCNGVISVDPTDTYLDNITWKTFLRKEFNFNLTRKNYITFSVLHELGHHHTADLVTEEEWNASQIEVENAFDHYYKPVELIATKWAVAFYKQHDMDAWNREVMATL